MALMLPNLKRKANHLARPIYFTVIKLNKHLESAVMNFQPVDTHKS